MDHVRQLSAPNFRNDGVEIPFDLIDLVEDASLSADELAISDALLSDSVVADSVVRHFHEDPPSCKTVVRVLKVCSARLRKVHTVSRKRLSWVGKPVNALGFTLSF